MRTTACRYLNDLVTILIRMQSKALLSACVLLLCAGSKQHYASSFTVAPSTPNHYHYSTHTRRDGIPSPAITTISTTKYHTSHTPLVIAHGGRDLETGKNPTSFTGSSMTVAEYPNPVLRRHGEDVTDFDDDDFQRICTEMMTIMYQADGVGLAAPQVNLPIRLFVYNPTGDPDRPEAERVVVNPKILQYSESVDVEEEACLSSRSGRCGGMVARSTDIMVEYRNERGNLVRKKLSGFEARVFQHEYDHTCGILHFDRFAPEDREKIQPELDVLVAEYDREDGVLELTDEVRASLRPPPLPRRGWMPPILTQAFEDSKGGSKKKKKKKTGATSKGFGGGGFGKS